MAAYGGTASVGGAERGACTGASAVPGVPVEVRADAEAPVNPVHVAPLRIAGLRPGWASTHCVLCGKSLGIVYPGRSGICVSTGTLLQGPHRFTVEHWAHKKCLSTTSPTIRMVAQTLQASHLLAELLAQLN